MPSLRLRLTRSAQSTPPSRSSAPRTAGGSAAPPHYSATKSAAAVALFAGATLLAARHHHHHSRSALATMAAPRPADGPYGPELEAAMAAVRLASSLCEVSEW
jgi:hypothetical protein